MLHAEHALSHFEELALDPLSLGISALAREGGSQIARSPQRIWMLCTENALSHLKHLAQHRLCLRALALLKKGQRQIFSDASRSALSAA
jgi:hypothetical protein